MATARDFINLAMKEAGVLGVGQTALPEDINDCFTLLTRMLAQWQQKRWIVPNLIDVSAVANGAVSNLIGPGQHYNVQRPDKIQAAYFKQLNSGSDDVSYNLIPIWSRENYSAIALKDLQAWPSYYFYDNAFPYGNVYIWPIPTSEYEIHLVMKGPIGFSIQLGDGEIEEAGSLYTDGTYLAVDLTAISGFGSGATADITIAGGIVTTVAVNSPVGDGYKINDRLSVLAADVGGTGSGFIFKVTEVTSSLDAEFNMPPEYEEPIHYCLAKRISSMYQMPMTREQLLLAAAGLKTIRNSNTQISKLQMPSQLRFGGNGGAGWYIFNADQY